VVWHIGKIAPNLVGTFIIVAEFESIGRLQIVEADAVEIAYTARLSRSLV